MSAIDQSSHITAEEANERSPPRPSHAAEPERTPDTAEETGVDTCSNDDASATTSREQPPSKRCVYEKIILGTPGKRSQSQLFEKRSLSVHLSNMYNSLQVTLVQTTMDLRGR
ncbi:uncharacterized protein LOC119169431 isoform X1 [Rhipicephalus microplus]|uniref:uncharacterized protein LOC119169431 isoform X1 n=1 Tax=Rhipicephalus microplus TaxID=6941 RepID=UPI003F6A846A